MKENLCQLTEKPVAVQSQARQLGLYVGDRELLTCPQCGLRENVDSDGCLFTCRADDFECDMGLRFEEQTLGAFRCPVCGAAACEEAGE